MQQVSSNHFERGWVENDAQMDNGIDMSEVNEWADYLRSCGRKENTIHSYRKALSVMFRCLNDGGRSYQAEDITTDDILYLRDNLRTKEEVTHSYLRILAGLIVFKTGKDVVKQTALLWNRESRHRVFVEPEDWATLYRIGNPLQRMVLMLGGMMGLRRAEMCTIMDDDISGDMMTVHGKGHGKQGYVQKVRIPGPVMDEIREYRKHKRFFPNSGDGYLLQNLNPIEGKLSHVSPSSLSNLMRDMSRETGLNVTCHGLRRMYATTLYFKTKCDTASLKSLMRHADVSTTFKCYIDAYDLEERQAVDRLSEYMVNVRKQQNRS